MDAENPVDPRYNPESLGGMIRSAREDRGLGVRELARLSGISAGQISRLENESVDRPSAKTLVSIATALGRHSEPLLFAAGIANAETVQEWVAEFESRVGLEFGEDVTLALAGEVDSSWVASFLWDRTYAAFVARMVAGEDVAQASWELDEIGKAWERITPERRKVIRAFVADQEVLSTLDAAEPPLGRYSVTVTLSPREHARRESSDE
jgi:transcriptional regulator with XRE-family HTH domain